MTLGSSAVRTLVETVLELDADFSQLCFCAGRTVALHGKLSVDHDRRFRRHLHHPRGCSAASPIPYRLQKHDSIDDPSLCPLASHCPVLFPFPPLSCTNYSSKHINDSSLRPPPPPLAPPPLIALPSVVRCVCVCYVSCMLGRPRCYHGILNSVGSLQGRVWPVLGAVRGASGSHSD